MSINAEESKETISKVTMMKYKNYHLWMLIPFVISILGFSYSYYFNLTNATFHQHVHGISETLWYVLVIVQPYLIIRKQSIQRHKTLGTIGIILAGIWWKSFLKIMNTDRFLVISVHYL